MSHNHNKLETMSLDTLLMQELYKSDGLYDSLTNIFEERATEIGRSQVISAYNKHVPLAVYAQRIGESGFTSVTVGETPDTIAELRWRYRLLLPGPTDKISHFHYSEHYGGAFSNKPPLVEYTNGAIILKQDNPDDWEFFKEGYLKTVRQACEDVLAATAIEPQKETLPASH